MSDTENQTEFNAEFLTTPDLEGIPEDDSAEPEDAGVDHDATEEEVEA